MKSVKNPIVATAILAGLVILFVIAAFPAVSNAGPFPQVREVPFPYLTIQEAIDAADDGDTVLVHPGTYTDAGNRDLDFNGLAITVRSEDPDEEGIVAATIIDCNGAASDPHRAFIFQSGEDANSVLAGFTIINGYTGDPNAFDPNAFGGAISCTNSSPTIRNCIITNSTSSGSSGRGGGIYCDPNSNPTISNCEITSCSAIGSVGGAYGGGICIDPCSSAAVSNCTVSNCSVSSGGGLSCGGGIYYGMGYSGAVIVVDVSDCLAEYGAGIYCDANSVLAISGTGILNNTATADGAGIYCEPNCDISISGTDILNNTATADGAGIYCDSDGMLTLEDCNVSQNTATADGGGIYYVAEGVLMLNNCNIRDNSSVGGDGGGIWYDHGEWLSLNNCDLSSNAAGTGVGGGIYGGDFTVALGTTVVINNSTVSHNRAVFGGGICLVEADLTINDSTVSDNTAEYGGGVYWYNSEANINNCTVSGNSAVELTYCSGGGFYCLDSSAIIKDCLMTDNVAQGFGGAMFFSGPNLPGGTQEITNCLITDNTADLDGGGIYCDVAAMLKMTNCTVAANQVLDIDGSGGGLSCHDASVEIVNSIFWGNIARNQEEEWVARYNGPENDEDSACDIATDASGNVYVTGTSWGGRPADGGTSFDYATVKYDTAGNELWAARYPGDPNYDDNAEAIAVDASGNVYVTGWSMGGPNSDWSYDFATVKYDPAGNELWVARYSGEPNVFDAPYDIAVDASGNVYVTGESYSSWQTNVDFLTIKYDTNGNELWVALYNGPSNNNEAAEAIAVDASGNVYVTGWSWDDNTKYDYATVKYDTAGNELWVARYDPNWYDGAYAIALDASGNVYVTGESAGVGTGADYATVKYDTADGNELWVARYNGEPNLSDYTWAIAVDASGSVYVTGQSMGVGTGLDYATVKYDATDGNELWVARYNGPENGSDVAQAIGVDSAGKVYVTGYSRSGSTWDTSDYVTIKYDVNGNQFWLHRYNGPGNGRDEAVAMALDAADNVYITGVSRGSGTVRPGRDYWDYATIKYYEQVGEGGDGPQIAVGDPLEPDNPPAIVMLSYSDVQGGEEYVFVAQGCTLSWGEGGLDADPMFIEGYHLSQIEAGDITDTDSPCVDAGSDTAVALGLHTYTTRTDSMPDTDIVDIGYHYRLPSMLCDLDFDGDVDLADLRIFSFYWLEEDCDLLGDCEGADFDLDTNVNFLDYAIYAQAYAPADETPPWPDPSTWAVEPYAVPESSNSISMTATTAFDESGVEYRFVCTGGDGHSSGWQGGSTYIDTGLFEDITYTYKVQTHDKSPRQNRTAWSVEASAYIDLTPPTPNPSEWETEPYEYYNPGDGEYYNRMEAVTASDPSGVEYYFWCRTGLPYHSGWQDSPIYDMQVPGPNQRWVYKVKTRDKSPHQNETGWSELASARQ